MCREHGAPEQGQREEQTETIVTGLDFLLQSNVGSQVGSQAASSGSCSERLIIATTLKNKIRHSFLYQRRVIFGEGLWAFSTRWEINGKKPLSALKRTSKLLY